MLLGPPRRKLQRQLARSAFSEPQSLQLPFLCPALFRSHYQKRTTASRAEARTKSRTSASRSPSQHQHAGTFTTRRGHASAAAELASYEQDPIPFDLPPSQPAYASSSILSQFSINNVAPLSGYSSNASPLILNDTPTTSLGRLRIKRGEGISGDINEIHQTLHACLQVGRLERAAVLVRRLNDIYKPSAPGLLAAHKDYLREVTLRVIDGKDSDLLQNLLKWFEVEIRQRGVPQDGTVFALIIQACLQDSDQKRSARAVRRYYNMARELEVEGETKSLVPQLEAVFKTEPWYEERSLAPDDTMDYRSSAAARPDDAPGSLREVDIKGQGLITVRKSLASLLGRISRSADEVSKETLSDHDRQRMLEKNSVTAAVERWQYDNAQLRRLGINSALSEKSPIGAMMWKWHEQLVPLVKEELRLVTEAEGKSIDERTSADQDRLEWGPYLQQVSPEKASAVTIMSSMTALGTEESQEGLKLVHILQDIANAIRAEAFAEMARKDGKRDAWRKLSQKRFQRRNLPSVFAKLSMADEINMHEARTWPRSIQFKVSAMLLSRLTQVARVEVSRNDAQGKALREARPVFFHTFQYRSGKRVGILKLHSVIVDKMARTPMGSALAKHLPMVCEPRPWKGIRDGGFLEQSDSVVRMHTQDLYSHAYLQAAGQNGDLDQVFHGLNVLGKVPWSINRPVYDVMAEAWNSGEAIANIPPEKPVANYPPEPPSFEGAGRPARAAWHRAVAEIDNHIGGLKSQRCFMNFQLEIARAFVGETFYFPHNVDFRGRAYPMAPFLNHMGADHARGLLRFAKGKELGSSGLWWLKVHLANIYGYDKASFKERSAFTETHLEDIADAATKPLAGSRWWLKAEDPWQCLAACIELHNALQLDDPTKFVSRLAIHQDGTCNGLQHYAALGGDLIGAKQVNLEPGDRPSDIYTGVSEKVKEEIHREAEAGVELAQRLDGHITRKVVKQTVMTNVYGVTLVGAERQVKRQLEEIFRDKGFPDDKKVNLAAAGNYIARKIFTSLSNMFNGAHDIQRWFGQCGNRICESFSPNQILAMEQASKGAKPISEFKRSPHMTGKKSTTTPFVTPIVWTTPLKMPVVQPYRKVKGSRVTTEIQMLTLQDADATAPINKAKQLQGFPPNFIHSLDGTHMFLTAIRCHELGLTFASVHDSFWTHAADVDIMNKITRDAFVRMHSEDIVDRLGHEFKARYKGHLRMSYIERNHPAAFKVQEWREEMEGKIRSDRKANATITVPRLPELLLEGKRLRLLASSNPKEVEEGKAMVTPASIVDSMADHVWLPELEPLPTPTLGQIEANKLPTKSKAQTDKQEDASESAEAVDGSAAPLDGVSHTIDGGDVNVESSTKSKRSRKKPFDSQSSKLCFWTALTFPPVPKKGSFDIKRLKDSPYFFS